jgi:hypothetical protein
MNQQSDMQQQFEKAVSDSKALSERPNNDVLLQLYALYKQATEGDVYTEAPSKLKEMSIQKPLQIPLILLQKQNTVPGKV